MFHLFHQKRLCSCLVSFNRFRCDRCIEDARRSTWLCSHECSTLFATRWFVFLQPRHFCSAFHHTEFLFYDQINFSTTSLSNLPFLLPPSSNHHHPSHHHQHYHRGRRSSHLTSSYMVRSSHRCAKWWRTWRKSRISACQSSTIARLIFTNDWYVPDEVTAGWIFSYDLMFQFDVVWHQIARAGPHGQKNQVKFYCSAHSLSLATNIQLSRFDSHCMMLLIYFYFQMPSCINGRQAF